MKIEQFPCPAEFLDQAPFGDGNGADPPPGQGIQASGSGGRFLPPAAGQAFLFKSVKDGIDGPGTGPPVSVGLFFQGFNEAEGVHGALFFQYMKQKPGEHAADDALEHGGFKADILAGRGFHAHDLTPPSKYRYLYIATSIVYAKNSPASTPAQNHSSPSAQ